MNEEFKPFETKLEEIYKSIKEFLMDRYDNLYFYISPTGKLTSWVKDSRGKDGAGIEMKYTINVGQICNHHWEYLEKLNKEVELVHTKPKEYFFCTECGQVKPFSEFEDSVFAGYYCKECAKRPEIKALIDESHTKGFYD